VVNSNGIEAAYNTTSSKYSVRWQGEDSSGYEEGYARDVNALDIEELALRALAMARRSAEPERDLPAGQYTVVLAPECTATMLNFLTWLGFSGKDYLDGSSFMVGRMGEPVTGSQITITDDPLDPRTLGLPCDAAGVPKQRLALIDSGVARGVAHDANSAKRAGTASTGHDTGWNRPGPMNLVLAPGSSTREAIIGKVKRGVYISRFHYTNVVDPLNTVITGMTRDGTMLIENGEMTRGLTNFRFTQNVLAALANAEEISGDQMYYGTFWGSGCLVPDALLINDFNFSGKTDF
jgi:predicted Zn-dependent protease